MYVAVPFLSFVQDLRSMCQISPFMLYHASYELTLLSCFIPTMPGCYQPHGLWAGVWALSLKRPDSQKIWKLVEVYVCWRHVKVAEQSVDVQCSYLHCPKIWSCWSLALGVNIKKRFLKYVHVEASWNGVWMSNIFKLKIHLPWGYFQELVSTICLHDDYDIRLLKPIQHGIDTVLKDIWGPDIPSLHLPLNNIWGIQKILNCLGYLGDYTPTWGSQWAIIQVPINQPGWTQVAVRTTDPMWDPLLLPSVVVTSRGYQGDIEDTVDGWNPASVDR